MWCNSSIFLLIWALNGCGHSILYDATFFDSYVKLFEQESVTYGNPQRVTDLVITFSNTLPDNIAGRCDLGFDQTPSIRINIALWEMFGPERREMLVLHELGHCILGLDHDDTRSAIMNTMLPLSYNEHRAEMLQFYFTE